MKRNEKVLRPVWPNQGVEAAFREKLRALIAEMHRSTLYWTKAAYRANKPVLAQDASPAAQLRIAINKMTKYWGKRFDQAAKELAVYFTTAMHKRSDANLRAILKRGGFTVRFKMTKAMQDVMTATIAEQVGLIRSIPQQYLGKVQGEVMRSVQTGRDLATLTDFIDDHYDVTRKRATLIARDQNNKATASMMRVRQVELGIEECEWLHSHAGKKPRKTHLANHGKRYDPAKGWYDPDPKVKRYIWPGELINCRCVSKPVIKGFT
jgi:SPP1 gp7 family putative phage head morphogenesis protein